MERKIERDDEVYDHWLELLAVEDAAIYQGEAGLGLTLDQGLEMTVLNPGADSESVGVGLTRGDILISPIVLLLGGDSSRQ